MFCIIRYTERGVNWKVVKIILNNSLDKKTDRECQQLYYSLSITSRTEVAPQYTQTTYFDNDSAWWSASFTSK